MGFDELIVGGGAGHDDVGRDAGFIFADAFEDALALLGRRRAVMFCGTAEDDEGIEVGCGSVVRGDGEVNADEEESVGEDD